MDNKLTISIIIFIMIVALFGYSHWSNSPQYALKKIQIAIENKDRPMFEKYADSDQIIEAAVKDLSNFFNEEAPEKTDDDSLSELLIEEFSKGLSSYFFDETVTEENYEDPLYNSKNLMSGLALITEPAINYDINKNYDEFWENETEHWCFFENFCNSLEIIEIKSIKKDNQIARLTLETKNSKSGLLTTLELKFNKVDAHWKLVQILNLEELLIDELDEFVDNSLNELEEFIDEGIDMLDQTIKKGIKEFENIKNP